MDFDQYRQFLAKQMPEQSRLVELAETKLIQAYQAIRTTQPVHPVQPVQPVQPAQPVLTENDVDKSDLFDQLHAAVLNVSMLCMHHGRQWFSPQLHNLHQQAYQLVQHARYGRCDRYDRCDRYGGNARNSKCGRNARSARHVTLHI